MNDVLCDLYLQGQEAQARSGMLAPPLTDASKTDYSVTNDRVDRLVLVCLAMWSLLKERTDLTEEDLRKRVTELDLLDGRLDGKCTKPIVKCTKCASAISHKFNRCLFCGQQYEGGSPFSTV